MANGEVARRGSVAQIQGDKGDRDRLEAAPCSGVYECRVGELKPFGARYEIRMAYV